MIAIEHLKGPLWCIRSTAYSKTLRAEADKTPGLRFDKPTRSHVGYPDAIHVTAKRAAEKGLRIQFQGWDELTAPSGLLIAEHGAKGYQLRGYQKAGVEFLVSKSSEGCILADEMGVGKSGQAAVACRALRQKTVIVCPNSVRGVWLDPDPKFGELARWWPAAKIKGLTGIKPSPIDPNLDVVVIHYEILYAWVDSLITWGARTLVFDEGHRLVNLEARRSQAARKLAETASHRIMLTGTPIENRIKQFYGPIEVISPGRFSSGTHPFFKFGLRYCGGHQEQIEVKEEGVPVERRVWRFDGQSHLEELRERVTYTPSTPWGFILRRLKSQVDLELPPRTRQIIPIEVKRSFQAPIAFNNDRLMQSALSLAADGKWPHVVDLAVDHLESGAKVVVGTYRRKIAERIAAEVGSKIPNRSVEVSHGGLPVAKRDAIYRRKHDLLCVTFDSCKEGVNLLSYATNVIVAELTYSATTLLQFENRFGRFAGQKVLIQYLIAAGTLDEVIRKLILGKLGQRSAIGDHDDRLDADLAGLVKTGPEAQAERLRKLYESIIAKERKVG